MPFFLYTDIEGSTQLWEKHGDVMGSVLDRHDRILLDSIDGHGGRLVKHSGDGMFAVFDSSEARPLECALAMQRRLSAEEWGGIEEMRVRIAIHVGPAEYRAGDYFGPVVNRVARLLAVAWGGQILLELKRRKRILTLPIGRVSGEARGDVANIFVYNTLLNIYGRNAHPAELEAYGAKNAGDIMAVERRFLEASRPE